ncbi:hypothetical protein PRIPAC_80830 [Pristionchus pacificus]|uniref:G protein-coupled receptor n=1 Tax=Pristionchus pacificus TaxID=54126 RepID=A0A2A6CLJ2_PRIPA|nr:hypothetical protein PRIPAC_80830 [Pristionchus pacificus]|eukprot:PDM78913.1 G protein-coupled receptor [Pristionchus pacificus]
MSYFFYTIVEDTHVIGGFITNILLMYTIVKFSRKSLGTYKEMLLIFAAYDIFLVFLHAALKPRVVVVDTTVFGVAADWDSRYITCFYCCCNTCIARPHLIPLFADWRFVAFLVLIVLFEYFLCFWVAIELMVEEGEEFAANLLAEETERRLGTPIKAGWLVMHHWVYNVLNVRVLCACMTFNTIMFTCFTIAITYGCLCYYHIYVLRGHTISSHALNMQRKLFVSVQTFPIIYDRNNSSTSGRSYHKNDLKGIIEFILRNSFAYYGGNLYQQQKGIPQGNNASPQIADLTLAVMEYQYIRNNIQSGHPLSFSLNRTFIYIDDLFHISDKKDEFVRITTDMYHHSLTLEQTNTGPKESAFLDMSIKGTITGAVQTSLYNKTDDYSFSFSSLRIEYSNCMGLNTLHGEIIRIFRNCSLFEHFLERTRQLARYFLQIQYPKEILSDKLILLCCALVDVIAGMTQFGAMSRVVPPVPILANFYVGPCTIVSERNGEGPLTTTDRDKNDTPYLYISELPSGRKTISICAASFIPNAIFLFAFSTAQDDSILVVEALRIVRPAYSADFYVIEVQNKRSEIFCADFSSLFTNLPHSVVKEKLYYLIDLMFKNAGSEYIVVQGTNVRYDRNNSSTSGRSYHKNDLKGIIEFILRNSFAYYGGNLYQQQKGIPQGNNASPQIAFSETVLYSNTFWRELVNLHVISCKFNTERKSCALDCIQR